KISKRRNPWARLTWFKEQGYLPEALLNFLGLLGYPPIIEPDGTEREVFTFDEFVERFDWAKVNKVGPIFNLDKLDWLNGHYIRELSVDDLASRLLPVLQDAGVLGPQPTLPELGRLKAVTELVQTRIVALRESVPLDGPFCLADADLVVADDARAQLRDNAPQVLRAALQPREPISGSLGTPMGEGVEWSSERSETPLREALADVLGIKPR